MKVGYIGFGDFGKQIQHFISEVHSVEKVVYFDDALAESNIGEAFSDYLKEAYADFSFYVGLGYLHLQKRNEIVQSILQQHRKLPQFIHPRSFVASSSRIDEGCMIYPFVNIDANVWVKAGAVLHNSVIVSHDSTIGACAYLSPGAVISGNVIVGDTTFIGSGCVVANGVEIGNNCRIGIGSVVTKSLPDNTHAIGNPLHILHQPLHLG
ncbi:MAG: acetyltransferase [Bacteroidetes bacterium]|nr:acetyltransferase [Bacteroidota bacterium]